jgi:hypothetical protein
LLSHSAKFFSLKSCQIAIKGTKFAPPLSILVHRG